MDVLQEFLAEVLEELPRERLQEETTMQYSAQEDMGLLLPGQTEEEPLQESLPLKEMNHLGHLIERQTDQHTDPMERQAQGQREVLIEVPTEVLMQQLAQREATNVKRQKDLRTSQAAQKEVIIDLTTDQTVVIDLQREVLQGLQAEVLQRDHQAEVLQDQVEAHQGLHEEEADKIYQLKY